MVTEMIIKELSIFQNLTKLDIIAVDVDSLTVIGFMRKDGLFGPFLDENYMGHDTTKPVLGVSDKMRLKPVSSASETS